MRKLLMCLIGLAATTLPLLAAPPAGEDAGAYAPVSLVEKAGRFYAEQRWPGCRILSGTPYYAFDGSINAYAVQFAKTGCSWTTEAELTEQVATGEKRLDEVRARRPRLPEPQGAGLLPDLEATRPIEKTDPMFSNQRATSAAVHIVLPPEARLTATERQRQAEEHGKQVAAWRKEVRAAANAAVLPEQVGTVIIAARYDLYPLLEMFDGVASHLKFQSKVRRLAGVPKEHAKAVERSFYVGPMAVFHEPIAVAGSETAKRGVVINPLSDEVFDLTKKEATGPKGRLAAAPRGKNPIPPQEFWRSFETTGLPPGTAGTQQPQSWPPPQSVIWGVPCYHQDDYGPGCCSEVAAAQVLGYWEYNGYGTLIDNGDQYDGHENELIYALMHAMGYPMSPTGGTPEGNINDGIAAVCNSPLYGNNLSFLSDEFPYGSVTWADIVSNVDSKRPAVYSNGDKNFFPYWSHSTTLVGYRNDVSGHLIYLHYNYPPDGFYVMNHDNVNPLNEMMDTVRPGGTTEFDCVMSEDFEDGPWTFAQSPWCLKSAGATWAWWWVLMDKPHNWYTADPRPPGGDPWYSAFCSVGGNVPYVANMNSTAIWGPFSTYKASGDVSAYIWRHIPDTSGDALWLLVSTDGTNFYGNSYSGDFQTWDRVSLDLTNVPVLGSVMNKAKVWVALSFVSDGDSNVGQGAWVDDLAIRLYPVSYIQVLKPYSNQTFWMPDNVHIQWRSLGDWGAGQVKIDLYHGLSFDRQIVAATDNDGDFSWTAAGFDPLSPETIYQIKVTNVADSLRYGYSDFFTLLKPATVTVTWPSGNEWVRGTEGRVLWNWTGSMGDTVDIYLYKGVTLDKTMATGVTNNGMYDWPIPVSQTEGSDYRVRVRSHDWPAFFDDSEMFSIRPPDIAVTSPHTGDWWARGEPHLIGWEWEGDPGPNVKIELFRSGGSVLDYVITPSTANTGAYEWTIPAAQTPALFGYKIGITSLSNPLYADLSDPFTITTASALRLLSPNGGEWWAKGTTQTITWMSSLTRPPIPPVKLELLRTDEMLFPPQYDLMRIIALSTANDGSHTWVIPSDLPAGGGYKVWISHVADPAVNDGSDYDFRITQPSIRVVRPRLGERWHLATTRTIAWETSDIPSGELKIELAVNDQIITPTITARTPDTGFYNWMVPRSLPQGSSYRIRVASIALPSQSGWSEGAFSIEAPKGICLTSPGTGERVARGASYSIRWAHNGIPESQVRLALLKGLDPPTSIGVTLLHSGLFVWTIPHSLPLGNDYRVRITSLFDPACSDTSDGFFQIEEQTAARRSQWPLY